MLTTEPALSGAGECLYRGPLQWYVGRGSAVYDQRPLPLASKPDCIFLPVAAAALDAADIPWESPYQANDWRDLVAFVSAEMSRFRVLLQGIVAPSGPSLILMNLIRIDHW